MHRTLCFLLVAALLFVTAHRLPAPIQEVPESPTPAPEQPAKPKPKRTTKPKPKSETNELATTPAKQQPSPKQSRFAGKWVGTMPTFPAGDQAAELAVDPAETTMTVTWFGETNSAKAQLKGDTLQATFPPPPFQPQPHTWSLTPQPDGATARVRFQCFLNDATVVFHRTGTVNGRKLAPNPDSQTGSTATGLRQVEIPTARPVPERPGFVYNPFEPSSKRLLDVRGKPSGSKVKDPNTDKLFIVP